MTTITTMMKPPPLIPTGFTLYPTLAPPSGSPEMDEKQMKPAEKMLDDDINTQDDQILIGKVLSLQMINLKNKIENVDHLKFF